MCCIRKTTKRGEFDLGCMRFFPRSRDCFFVLPGCSLCDTLEQVGEVQAMLVKDASAAAVGPCDDGGDDDDARSCDSISGEKPQAACDDAEQMQRCSSSFNAVATAVAKLQAE